MRTRFCLETMPTMSGSIGTRSVLIVQTLKAPMVRPLIVDFEFKETNVMETATAFSLFCRGTSAYRILKGRPSPNVDSPAPLYGLEDEEQ